MERLENLKTRSGSFLGPDLSMQATKPQQIWWESLLNAAYKKIEVNNFLQIHVLRFKIQ